MNYSLVQTSVSIVLRSSLSILDAICGNSNLPVLTISSRAETQEVTDCCCQKPECKYGSLKFCTLVYMML